VSGIEDYVSREVAGWSRRKKDAAPRGVFRHRSGVWAARFFCGAGHRHQERVGTIKSEAISVFYERRARANDEPGWCPSVERQNARKQADAARERERGRITLREHSKDFISWAKVHHRSWTKDHSRLSRVLPVLGDTKLDEITTADVERFLGSLLEGEEAVSPATRNRYRDLLSGLFKRAKRLGLIPTNPVTGIPKLRESAGRLVYLPPATKDRGAYEEEALINALPEDLRPRFRVAIHTGLRWSEQARIRWRDVDVLTGTLAVVPSKNGEGRTLPMNTVVRTVLFDLSLGRPQAEDADVLVFKSAYRTVARAVERAVKASIDTLVSAGKDASRLEGFTWHGCRHTWASRLVMAGVDLLTVQRLGGWRTLAMVQRYAHLAPDHLRAAMERLVALAAPVEAPRAVEHERNMNESGLRRDTSPEVSAELCDSRDTEG
jgi:integrase